MTMQIQIRRDTAANWTAENPTLLVGEVGLETDTGRQKMGDGATAWNTLGYMIIEEPVAGDVIFGDATPKWAKLAKGDNGEVLTLVGGLPAWAAGGGGGVAEADLQFLDNFDDDERHWGWFDDAKNGSIVEAGELLTLSIANTVNGRICDGSVNNGPRCLLGDPGAPFEVKVKLNSYTVNDRTHAGIFITTKSSDANALYWYFFGRAKDSGQPVDGLATWNGNWIQFNAITTMPIYLRFRIVVLGLDVSARCEAAYSIDDISYTLLDTFYLNNLGSEYLYNMIVGIFVRNGCHSATYNAIAAPFEWFKMGRTLGPG